MTGFLLDTNVISELRKPRPNTGLVEWMAGVEETSLYLSCTTLGELRIGVELAVDDKRRDLERWLVADVAPRFKDRILAFDATVADRWGRLEGQARRTGATLPIVDGMLAATALRHDMILVTRNERDFTRTGVRLVNPWR